MAIHDRIKQIRLENKQSQQEIADILDIQATSVSKYERDIIKPSSDLLAKIAEKYNININWLLNEQGQMYFGQSGDKQVNNSHYNVRLISSNASAGYGDLALDSESDEVIQVSKNLFRTTPKEDNLRAVRIAGASMEPILQDGDVAIFCKGSSYDKEGLYIINKGNELFIKNLSVDLQNNLHVESSNPAYKSFMVPFESQEYTFIVGKVLTTISSY